MPEVELLRSALMLCRTEGLHFTLATPVITEPFLPRLRLILEELLPHFTEGDEILISDFGALAPIRTIRPDVTVILGRVLSGQKRGPQILELDMPDEAAEYFRCSAWSGEQARSLLAEMQIARIELDNLLQGIASVPDGLHGSLHYPYIFVTSGRNCPFHERSSACCATACKDAFRLESAHSARPLLQGGNTQFVEHQDIPAELFSLGIDRLVYHPELPR